MQHIGIHKHGILGYGTAEGRTLHLDQADIDIDVENILVIHKKTPKIVPSNTVGDGFMVPVLLQRDSYAYDLDTQYCIQGIMSYHCFNEKIGTNMHYAYKYPKRDLNDLNEIFDIRGLDVTAQIADQHISLFSQTYIPQTKIKNHSQLFSLLFGMSLIYGDLHTVGDEVLSHVRIDYPLIDSFLEITETLQQQKKACERDGLYRTIDIKEGKRGQEVQIDISDPEILHIYAQRLEIDAYEVDTSIITAYIQEHQSHIYPLLSNSVLKLLKK